jgi:nitroreductase
MEVSKALETRRTVRAFLAEPVPRETVAAILEAALRTPSWANT